MKPYPPEIFAQWKQSLSLLREAQQSIGTERQDKAVLRAAAYMQASLDAHLRRLGGLLHIGMTGAEFLCVLVPVERVASRDHVTDATMLADVTTDDTVETPVAPALPLIVILDNLRSAINLGGIFRTSEFFGVAELWLCGYTATPEHEHVAKSAMGTDKLVNWRYFENTSAAILEAKELGYRTYALETSPSASNINTAKMCFPCALVLGNERFGISEDAMACCDELLAIPGYGRKNSINVASAFAIAANAFSHAYRNG